MGPPSSATFRRGSPGKVGGARPVSGAFTLDLEKIESTVENMGEGGVRLVNHNLDEIFNDGPVRLPQTMTARQVLEQVFDGQVIVYREMAKLILRWDSEIQVSSGLLYLHQFSRVFYYSQEAVLAAVGAVPHLRPRRAAPAAPV